MFISVDLPAPFWPTRPRIAPARDRERHVADGRHAEEVLGDAVEARGCVGHVAPPAMQPRAQHVEQRGGEDDRRPSPCRCGRPRGACRFSVLESSTKKSTPKKVQMTLPLPPKSEVPPMTVAPMMSSRSCRRRSSGGRSRGARCRGSRRRRRRQPEKTKTATMTRRTGTPEISAALRLLPMAIDVAAEDRAAEQQVGDDGQRERDHHRLGDEGMDVAALELALELLAEIDRDDVARAEAREALGQVADVLRLGEPDREATSRRSGDQRHHEGRHAEAGDGEAVDERRSARRPRASPRWRPASPRGCAASRPPARSAGCPRAGCRRALRRSAAVAISTAATTLASPMTAPWLTGRCRR